MKFGAPYMAVVLWIVPAAVVFYVFAARKRAKVLEKFADKNLQPVLFPGGNAKRSKLKRILIVAAVFLIIFSLMRPEWGFKWQEVKRQGLDILIALDTSKSMLAEDVLPNRLSRAKLAIKDLVKKLHGDRVGLIVFSGTAFLQCPLTSDYNGFLLSLDDVDVDTIPVGGTSLAKAIHTAIDSYEGGKKENKILIIITDGEDLTGGVAKAVDTAKAKNVKIFCVGIGSVAGDLVPVKDSSGKISFLKDSKGNVVKTKLVEAVLRKISTATGGLYVRATGAEFGLDFIYEQKLAKLEKKELKSRMEKRYTERFQFPLIVAFLILLLEPFICERKRDQDRDVSG